MKIYAQSMLMLLFLCINIQLTAHESNATAGCIKFTIIPDDELIDCTDTPVFGVPQAVDNCCNFPHRVTYDYVDDVVEDGCETRYTRTWTATSYCGDVETASQTIIKRDITKPTLILNDPLLQGHASGDVIRVECSTPILLWAGSVSATDNCDSEVKVELRDQIEPGNCQRDGYFELMKCWWRATDECGNKAIFEIFIERYDTIAPIIKCPNDLVISCLDDDSPVFTGTADAVDACDTAITVRYNDDLQAGACDEVIYRTWTATDHCQNTTNCTQKITILDEEAPTITCPPSVIYGCESELVNAGIPTASDVCHPDNIQITSMDDTLRLVSCHYVIKRTWTARDVCDNTTPCIQNITYKDTIGLVLRDSAEAVSIECDNASFQSVFQQWLDDHGGASVTDECGLAADWTYFILSENDGCGDEKTISVEFKATDHCGNFVATTADFMITDTAPPVITRQASDLMVECDYTTEIQDWLNNNGGATATEACGNAYWAHDFISIADTCGSILMVTFSVVDDCGNMARTTANIMLEDTTAPVISPGTSPEVECNDTNSYPSMMDWVNRNGDATATDNCNDITWSNDFPGTETLGCGSTKVVSITFTATDDCGNSSDYVGEFTVIDTTPPTFTTLPSDARSNCDGTGNQADLDAWLNSNGGGEATDNCGQVTWSNDFDGLTVFCPSTSFANVTFTATDDCGNLSTASARFQIIDDVAPVFTNIPADIIIECDDALPLDEPTVADLCDPNMTLTETNSRTDGTCPQEFTFTRTWTATDGCGNTSTAQQTIIVSDTQAPFATFVPADMQLTCLDDVPVDEATFEDVCDANPMVVRKDSMAGDGCTDRLIRMWTVTDDCGNSMTASQVITFVDDMNPTITCPDDVLVNCMLSTDPALVGSATATDDCNDIERLGFSDQLDTLTTCHYMIERTWSAADPCGNESSCIQILEVRDNESPTITSPAQNESVECRAFGGYPELADWAAQNGNAVAADNCGDVTWTNDFPGRETLNCGNSRSYEIVFTATDDCGNSVQTTGVFDVVDTQAPNLAADAMDQTVQCDGTGNQINIDAWLDANGGALATDECGNVTWSNDFNGLSIDCGGTGEATVTFTATDECGNSILTTATFSVVDDIAPVFTNIPQNLTLDCNDALPTDEPTVFDLCDSNVDVTFSESDQPGNCIYNALIVKTWTATDDCGNTSTIEQVIQISDQEGPQATYVPANVTLGCMDMAPAADEPIFVDNCDPDFVVTFNETMTGDDCSGSVTREWTATDACGNLTKVTQVITTADNEPPVLTCPDDLTIECGESTAVAETGDATATDLCNDISSIDILEVNEFLTNCNSILYRTWTAIDACANESSCTQRITIEDTQAPTLTKENNFLDTLTSGDTLVYECDAIPVFDVDYFSASDSCDPNPNLSFDELIDIANDCHLMGYKQLMTCVWTAADSCGNQTDFVLYLKILDTEAPVIDCPDDVMIYCDDLIAVPTPMVTDNCMAPVNLAMRDDTLTNTACELEIERTYVAVDDCGNTSTCSHLISVVDNAGPVIVPNDSILIGVMSGDTLYLPCDMPVVLDANSAYSDDDCDPNPTLTFNEEILATDCHDQYRIRMHCTYEAVDRCGNRSFFEVYVFLIDDVAPIIHNVPADATVDCADVPPVPTDVYADDNCDFSMAVVNFAESEVVINPTEKEITRTWSIEDDCGNQTTEHQVIRAINCPTFFPEFTYFDASQIGDSKNGLRWGINQDMSFRHFYLVEHSIDGINFTNIGIVEKDESINGFGTDFVFNDNNPHPVNNFYRIKFIYAEAELEKISEVRAVLMADLEKPYFVFPNPVKEKLIIELVEPLKKSASVTITNLLGKVVYQADLEQGKLVYEIDFQELHDGAYFVTIFDLSVKPKTYRILKVVD